MAGLLEWLSNQKDSAANDYADLMSNYPNAQKFGKGLIKAISEHVPSNEDFKSPEAMRNWGTAAALNAPMGLTFIGKNAANWNPVKAAEAEKMLNAGVDPAQVWKEHLIGRMPDKSLFSEIDDSNMTSVIPLNKWVNKENRQSMAPNVSTAWDEAASQLTPQAPVRIKRLFEHEQLKKQYPYGFTKNYENQSIMDMPVFMHEKNSQSSGSLGDGELMLHPSLPPMPAKSTILHELQHAIQDREGWARGGSPSGINTTIGIIDEIKKQLPDLMRKKSNLLDKFMDTYDESLRPEMASLDRKISTFDDMIKNPDQHLSNFDEMGRDYYNRLTGEAQARATQDRMNMNMQQRRNTYPLAGGKLSDITLDQLINRYR